MVITVLGTESVVSMLTDVSQFKIFAKGSPETKAFFITMFFRHYRNRIQS